MSEKWHAMSIDEIQNELGTSQAGLTLSEAEQKLQENGYNELTTKKEKSALRVFLEQFKDFMIIILIIAAIVSALLGEGVDSLVIMVLVVINAVIGAVQELKAQQSLDALQKMAAPSAKVIRGGEQISIPAREVAVGDLVVLDTGDYVPADMRLVEFKSLQIQEAALTGESVPVYKEDEKLAEDAVLGDRVNMAFSSSLVTYGRGTGIAVETGMNTEVGKIAAMIQSAPQTETPMQKRLGALGKTLGIGALGICAIMFIVGVFVNGTAPLEMFMAAVALAVAAIPEGLPAISTVVLAMGVQRMAKRNAIIRTLPSVETLGSATIICSDKTGTLTQNRMTVKQFAIATDEEPQKIEELQHQELIHAAVLCTDAQITEKGAMGDPTETALLDMGEKLGFYKNRLGEETPRVAELPFDSDRKLMTTVHQLADNRYAVYTKGGLDEVLECCTEIKTNEGKTAITAVNGARLADCNTEMATKALRVLAFAIKYLDAIPEDLTTLESDLCYIGMVGMIDPPRPEAKEAVAKCHTAGIKPIMITGDHKLTASAIASELGILESGGEVITGKELEAMSDEELAQRVENISVYARVSPEHKVRIVDAWQKQDNIVAMTGDGVNDAPALKKADIGCSMGEGGTDVAKDASDLILVDDNFATVVSAVEEGRRIYDNVLKCVNFLVSSNIGEIIVLFVATLLGWKEMPLLPMHILLVNLVTDGLPALALGVDPIEKDIMKRQAKKQMSIFTPDMLWRIIYQGIMVGVLTMTAFILGQPDGIVVARTMAFAVLAMSQIVHSFNFRSVTKSIFVESPLKNRSLIGAGLLSLIIVLGCINIPGLNTLMQLTPLASKDLLEAILLALAPLVIVELFKALRINDLGAKKTRS